jgi:tol-pal system protein YbgF
MSMNRAIQLLVFTAGCLVADGQVYAQAQVVDAAGDRNTGPIRPSQPVVDTGQNDIMVNMYLQLEALQNEIQNLRGLVEEQSYQINRMQSDQRDRYLDLDSRVSELFSYHSGQPPMALPPTGGAVPGQLPPTGGNSRQPGETPIASNPGVGAATAGVTPQNEQELYRQALSLLLEDEAFQDSVNLFQQYIDIYPGGRYFTNALYWQGAALHLLDNYPQSLAVLQRLVDEYPQDPKAPTAMLRIGTVYSEMGDRARAVNYWQRIRQSYPNSNSEIEIASEYLGELGL